MRAHRLSAYMHTHTHHIRFSAAVRHAEVWSGQSVHCCWREVHMCSTSCVRAAAGRGLVMGTRCAGPVRVAAHNCLPRVTVRCHGMHVCGMHACAWLVISVWMHAGGVAHALCLGACSPFCLACFQCVSLGRSLLLGMCAWCASLALLPLLQQLMHVRCCSASDLVPSGACIHLSVVSTLSLTSVQPSKRRSSDSYASRHTHT